MRTKIISGKKYAYLVESIKTPSGPRQKVKQYIGRVFEFDCSRSVSSNVQGKTAKLYLKNLVINYLLSLGFKEKDGILKKKKIYFNLDDFSLLKKTSGKPKSTAIGLNEGYICTFTLSRILNFTKSKNVGSDARILAKYFVEAGFSLSKEQFIQFYQLLK